MTDRASRAGRRVCWLLPLLAACASVQGAPADVMPPPQGGPADPASPTSADFVGPPAPSPFSTDAATDAAPAAAPPAPTPASAARDALPPTRLAQDSFVDDMLVVLVRTERSTNVGLGSSVARVLIEDQLAGPALDGEREILVLAYAGDLVRGHRDLLFLQPFRGGPRWSIERRLDGRDPDFRAKLELTRRTAALLDISQPGAREAATFDLIYDALVDRRPWTRRYAVSELGWIASTRADLFTDIRLRRLEALAAESPHSEVRVGVESVAIILSRRNRSLPGAPPQESSRP